MEGQGKRWIPMQDVLDDLEAEETERLFRVLTRWIDDPAYLPVERREAPEEVAPAG